MKMTQELINEIDTKRFAYEAEKKRLEKRIENAQARLAKHEKKRVFWTLEIVKPICEAIAEHEHLHLDKNERYLTFGCRAYCPVFFHDDNGKCVGGISFTCGLDKDNKTIIYYDTGRKKYECDSMSLAGLNGFDNETAPLPNTLEEIIEKCLYKRAIK